MTAEPPAVETLYNKVRVSIGGITHVLFDRREYQGHQAWTYGPSNCSIEYYLRGGTSILTEYDSLAKWKAVLAGLDAAL